MSYTASCREITGNLRLVLLPVGDDVHMSSPKEQLILLKQNKRVSYTQRCEVFAATIWETPAMAREDRDPEVPPYARV